MTVRTDAVGGNAFLHATSLSSPDLEKIYLRWETLLSANATLSLYCPAPSLSLESALRHTVKASWNIWKKGGRVREREATVKSTAACQDVALLFSGSPSFSFQHRSRTALSPQAACLK